MHQLVPPSALGTQWCCSQEVWLVASRDGKRTQTRSATTVFMPLQRDRLQVDQQDRTAMVTSDTQQHQKRTHFFRFRTFRHPCWLPHHSRQHCWEAQKPPPVWASNQCHCCTFYHAGSHSHTSSRITDEVQMFQSKYTCFAPRLVVLRVIHRNLSGYSLTACWLGHPKKAHTQQWSSLPMLMKNVRKLFSVSFTSSSGIMCLWNSLSASIKLDATFSRAAVQPLQNEELNRWTSSLRMKSEHTHCL